MAGCGRAGGKPCPHDPPHGTYGTYNQHGCRCDPCVEAGRRWRAGRGRTSCRDRYDECPHADLKHGTINAYCNHACRCEPCRRAWYLYQRELKGRARARARREPDTVRHGLTGYVKFRCRCPICRRAAAESRRRSYVKRRGEGGGV